MKAIIIDDHRMTALSLSESLSARGVEVVAVEHGVTGGIKAIGEHDIDVVVTDLVTVAVANDGDPLGEGVPAGLGSYTLDQLATAGWSRETSDDGRTILRASFLTQDVPSSEATGVKPVN